MTDFSLRLTKRPAQADGALDNSLVRVSISFLDRSKLSVDPGRQVGQRRRWRESSLSFGHTSSFLCATLRSGWMFTMSNSRGSSPVALFELALQCNNRNAK